MFIILNGCCVCVDGFRLDMSYDKVSMLIVTHYILSATNIQFNQSVYAKVANIIQYTQWHTFYMNNRHSTNWSTKQKNYIFSLGS